jgi:hypothetical protein
MKHNQAMHRMPKPPLCDGFGTGDGGRYVLLTPDTLQGTFKE